MVQFDEKAFNKKVREHRVKQWIDALLPKIFLAFALLWLVQSVATMIYFGTVFTPVKLWLVGLTMHATTSLSLSAIYLVSYLFFRTFQLGHMRVVRAVLFTVLGVVFYDLLWSVGNFAVNGSGSFVLPLASTAVIFGYLVIIHRQQPILDLRLSRLLPIVAVFVVSLALFVASGFFLQWGLYERGLAVDPTGWVWLLNKSVALWMWVAFELR